MKWTKRIYAFAYIKIKKVGFFRALKWRMKIRDSYSNVWRGFPPGNKIPRLLKQGQYEEVINYAVHKVLKDSEKIAFPHYCVDQHVVLSGYRRSGKTAVSHVLARRFRYFVVPVDELRRCWRTVEDPEIQFYIKHEVVRKILMLSKVKICLEGDSFIYGAWVGKVLFPEVDLSFATKVSSLSGCKVAFVGSADCDINTKLKSIEVHRQLGLCWTARHTESERMRIVEESITISNLLRNSSLSIPATYYEIDLNSFESSIRSIAEKISS